MTLLVASILCDEPAVAARRAAEALARGADVVELRVDRWPERSAAVAPAVRELPAGRWMMTCRSAAEGGGCDEASEERIRPLLAAIDAGGGQVDFEYADWRRSETVRRRLGEALVGGPGGTRLILSAHDFAGRPEDPAALVRDMSAEANAAAVKIAWQAQDAGDNLVAFDVLRSATVPTVAICMGEAGLPSRVLARKFNAYATYCAPATGESAAPGQLTLDEMLDRYRWRSIDASTGVFGVLGDPVAHSLSPVVFNAAFERYGINAVYLPIRLAGGAEALNAFLAGCCDRPWLEAGGFSVTVPHKEAAAAFVGERIEPLAREIGAVNTLVADAGGFSGHNTDYAGALGAITNALGCERSGLAGLRADILGAGGVARAVVAGLRHCGAEVTLFNRNAGRADSLAGQFGCGVRTWAERGQPTGADLLVNCTSLGMWPEVDASPVPPERLTDCDAVFDTVYHPVRTRLLREAEQAGRRTIDGLAMFVHQAAAQFELWTRRAADGEFLRRTVEGVPAFRGQRSGAQVPPDSSGKVPNE